MIKIIGLGPGDPNALTVGAIEELKNSNNVYFRTEIHPTVDYIKKCGNSYNSYDYFYETCDSFDQVYLNIAEDIIKKYDDQGDLIYAVPGHPLVAERSVTNLIELCKKDNIKYEVIPAVSFVDAMMERLEIDPIAGLKIIDAFDIKNQILDKRIGTIITQVYNGLIASEVKIKLSEFYDDETEIFYCRAVGIDGEERICKIPLYELDMQEDIDYLTSIYIPKDDENKKDIYDLLNLVEVLRGENGCPWDKEQSHESIKKAIVEESYEVLDAIEKEDYDGLIEELGDVLFQVIFHASIENDEGFYNFSDVVEGVYNKMTYRHPHVFGEDKLSESEDVIRKWDELKKEEKNFKKFSDELEGVAKALPALIRANKIQKKANKIGFDMENIDEVIIKLKEEINEVIEVYKNGNRAKITEEIGDLIFSCVNIARFLEVDSEEALNLAIDKFINRIKYIEEAGERQNLDIKDMDLDYMNKLWNESKKLEK